MQTQDAPAEFFFKLWPWLEANKNRLIGLLVAVLVVSGILFYLSSQREHKELAAGQALSSLLDSPPAAPGSSGLAASLEQLATTYAGTAAGQRAQLQAAAALFEAGNYADAQAQFQKYVDADPNGLFAATAELGVASCLEAQNKPDLAAGKYQRVLSVFPGSPFIAQAEFGLGRIAEQQNRLSDAVSHYDKVAAGNMGGTLAQEADLRSKELKLKQAAAAPQSTVTPKPAAIPQLEAAPKATAVPPQPPNPNLELPHP
jgi:predicted negative regulator of RcsB-dependent stress response